MRSYSSSRNKSRSLYEKIAGQDFHVHTFLSPCAHDPDWTPEKIVRLAEEAGMETIVLTDHYYERRPGFEPPPFYSGADDSCYRSTLGEISALDTDVEVLASCEIDMIRPGLFTLSESFAMDLPVGLVSASHYHLEGIEQPPGFEPGTVGKYILGRMRAAISWPPAQILAHPLSALQGSLGDFGRVLDTIDDDSFREVLASARENEVAIEIRASVFGDENPLRGHHTRFYSLAREQGCRIAPVSDAHKPRDFGSTREIVPWAEKFGFEAEDIIDTSWLEKTKEGKRARARR